MSNNCGIIALNKISEIKNISAFTIIHMARDNNIDLHFFKVNDLVDLPRVTRPAIFHQKDHFVMVRNGEPMPDGEYTGYVIGGSVLGRVIGLSEAKFITGGKNFLTGKNSDGEKVGGGALGTILAVVGGIAGTLIGGPGVGAAIGGAIGGAGGNAITGDNPITGAATGALAGLGTGQLTSAFGAAKAATGSLASQTTAFGGGTAPFTAPTAITGASSLANGASSLASGVSAFGGGTTPFANAAGNAASATGNFTANPSFNLSSVPFSSNSIKSLNIAQPSTASSGGGGSLLDKAGSAITKSFNDNPIGSAATLAGAAGVFGSKQPEYNGASPTANYSAVSQFLGPNALATASKQTNLDYVNTPISDLQSQFTKNNQRTLDTINTAYDNQKNQLVHQFAQAGQNLANSSELQDKVGQLEQKRTNDLTLAQQELTDQALGQAIQVKQQALSSGLQSGQWDQSLAFQLAQLTGDQENLQYAIANNDYESFQQIMGKLMTMGIPQTVNLANASGKKINIT